MAGAWNPSAAVANPRIPTAMEAGMIRALPLLLLAGWATAALAQEALPVTVERLDAIALYPVRSAPATAVSLNDTRVAAQVGAEVQALPVRPGDRIDADEVLARLDCRDLEIALEASRAALAAAQAQRDLAEFRRERGAQLRDRGAMPLEAYREREAEALRTAAEVRRRGAEVRRGERDVERCEVRAPFDAVVVERLASVGELAEPGTPLVRLVDVGLLEISARVQEQDLDALEGAASVDFVSRGERYPLRLRRVIPVLESRLRSYEVRLEPTGRAPLPGESGRIDWAAAQPHVPSDLLVERDGSLGVFVVEDGRARHHALEEAVAGLPAAVPGLQGSADIVRDGRYALRDGMAVDVTGR